MARLAGPQLFQVWYSKTKRLSCASTGSGVGERVGLGCGVGLGAGVAVSWGRAMVGVKVGRMTGGWVAVDAAVTPPPGTKTCSSGELSAYFRSARSLSTRQASR